MRRELREEVSIDVTKEMAVAVINDDSTEVGFVHLGVVHVVYVADEALANRRSGIVSPEFIPMSEAVKNLDAYESCIPLLSGKSGRSSVKGCRHRARPRHCLINEYIRRVSKRRRKDPGVSPEQPRPD